MKSSPEVDNYFATGTNDIISNLHVEVIIEYFESKFSDFRDCWELVVKKAKKWMASEAKHLKIEGINFNECAKLLLKNLNMIT